MDTPVWSNDCDPVAGRYASGEQTIGEVLNPLGPEFPSVPVPVLGVPLQLGSPDCIRIFDRVLDIWMANSDFVGLNKGSTKKKLDGIQRRDVDRQPRWQPEAVAGTARRGDAWRRRLKWCRS